MHCDLMGFDFEATSVDGTLAMQLAEVTFTDEAHDAILAGGTGSEAMHLVTAIGVTGMTRHGKRVQFYSAADLVNALEQEKAHGKAHSMAGGANRDEPTANGSCDPR